MAKPSPKVSKIYYKLYTAFLLHVKESACFRLSDFDQVIEYQVFGR